MKIDILIDSKQFFSRLEQDIQRARENVYVQAMTFEADRAGTRLGRLLMRSPATDIRLLVDSYVKAVMSDKFLFSLGNLFNRTLRDEYRRTFRLFENLRSLGVQVLLANPLGPFGIFFPNRNHKKLIVIDDRLSYIGGINFSDHNFSWHDMMLRVEDRGVAEFLKNDFLATWSGSNQCRVRTSKLMTIVLFDGKTNKQSFETIFKLIDGAKKSICVESPYLTFPFYAKLRAAHRRGVAITLICPEENNKSSIQKYTYWEAQRSNFSLRLIGKMTHLKAMLIDDQFLVVGSSNFDCISYSSQQEIVAVIRGSEAIRGFQRHVMTPDWNRSVPWTGKASRAVGFIRYAVLRTAHLLYISIYRISMEYKVKYLN